jgi:hypothetical protein
MTEGRKKAIADLAESLRKQFPNYAGFSDEEIMKQYGDKKQIERLVNYIDALIESRARLDSDDTREPEQG